MNKTIKAFDPAKPTPLRTNTSWPPELAAWLKQKSEAEYGSDINEALRAVVRQVWLTEKRQQQGMSAAA